ncbi:MAG: precorrin methylase [Alphaproteobacteria bacterium]|nr:precorrin methylase [Alphaproteobacteria bacterium]
MRVAGIGFRKDAPLSSLRAVLMAVEAIGGRADALASLPEKVAAPLLQALALECGLPLISADVRGIATPTQSPRIQALHGTGSASEAAALAVAGPGAKITVARICAPDGMATCAMAEKKDPTS